MEIKISTCAWTEEENNSPLQELLNDVLETRACLEEAHDADGIPYRGSFLFFTYTHESKLLYACVLTSNLIEVIGGTEVEAIQAFLKKKKPYKAMLVRREGMELTGYGENYVSHCFARTTVGEGNPIIPFDCENMNLIDKDEKRAN